MKLDLSSYEKAIFQLDSALNTYNSDLVQSNSSLLMHVRAGSIQAFEFVYELSHKLIKRYLEMSEPTSEIIDQMSFRELIRTACEKGLIESDVNQWTLYREYRSTTSHTYAEDKAELIFEKLPQFLKEAQGLLAKLHERNR
ncbi:MAG: HI0074 family nucleotidyltransferase substrate-binding subunit [Pseudomonadota bacterium]